MYCRQCFRKINILKNRTFNDKNRWIIKRAMVLKKLLPHLATRGTYSPGDWRCDEAWREQTLVHPPVMCQQRLSYWPWELNVMFNCFHDYIALFDLLHKEHCLFNDRLKRISSGVLPVNIKILTRESLRTVVSWCFIDDQSSLVQIVLRRWSSHSCRNRISRNINRVGVILDNFSFRLD